MSTLFAPAILLLTLASAALAPDATILRSLLDEFLAGASRNDVAVHERFWAEDLIYTGSSGRRVGKAQILADLRAAPPPAADEVLPVFTAEDVRIQQYGDAALVAFQLVATSVSGDSTQVGRYLNSGMFLKRKGRWQVVGWQATKLP